MAAPAGAVPVPLPMQTTDGPVFISEIHYDNVGIDEGEAIEVTAPVGADLTGWTLVLYNGANGATYGSAAPVGGIVPAAGVLVVTYPTDGIQNGAPDGAALVDADSNVVEFLSYEGTFTAANGPAADVTSTDIGVEEGGTTPVGHSLQKIDGTWTGAAANTFGALNGGGTDPDPDPVNAFISEIHYDNVGTDEGEAIEVTAPVGADLTGWTLVLYNGSGGAAYDTDPVGGIVPPAGVLVVTYPANGIQNGSPDGIALVDADGNVVEFLSYEGTFTATGGPAAGMTSTDIGVAQAGSEPVGLSLQKIDGIWTGPAEHTFGARNDEPPFVSELHYDNVGVDTGEAIEVTALVGADLTGWTLVLYNGANGQTYRTDAVGGVVPATGVLVVTYPTDGIQNGAPDGVALVDGDGNVVEFLSYEGTFTAANGPAAGMTSTDIGVEEGGATPVGHSLQKINGVWTGPAENTFGSRNDGGSGDQPPVASCVATLVAPFELGATTTVSATDDHDGIGAIGITSVPVTGITLEGIDLGAGSAVLTVAPTTTPGNYDVDITFSTDAAEPQTATCTVTVTVESDPDVITLISAVQGSGAVSPIAGQTVTIEGIVTSLFSNNDLPDAFFVQEEDVDADGDDATSEGVYVFCRGQCPTEGDLAVGDQVRVRGLVNEFQGMTQVSSNASGGSINILSSDNTLPTPAELTLPASGSTRDLDTYESTESMVVTYPGTLVVSEYFELARYGQLVLTADERPYQFTHTHAPSADGYAAFLADLNTRRIILDDDNNNQNDMVEGPDSNEPYPWPQGGLSVDNRVRGGDTLEDLTAVMHWSWAGFGDNTWRLRPIDGVDYTFESVNPAPEQPDDVGGSLTVVSYNVLNYFAQIDTTASTSNGPCGPSGTMDCRGADSEAERVRQLAKIAAGLSEIDAHVAGLLEIENDEGLATQQIVDALNTLQGPGTYAAIETGFIGTDAIKTALIYQPGSVTPVGEYAILDSSVDPRFLDNRNRPVLIQTFEENGTGERFTIAVNHLKSKGSACDSDGDPDRNDGQGNCAGVRTAAAQALADYLATDPTGSGDPDFLIVGDLNSYAKEDPITALNDAGYTDLHALFEGPEGYSYVFDGQLGYLDTALANESLLSQVTGTTSWHINADEVPLFDYNDEVLDSPGEAAFERESNALPLYAPDALRSSDHDPVIVGLGLVSEPDQTPQEALKDLRQTMAGMKINILVRVLLDVELRLAEVAVDLGKPKVACGILIAFDITVKGLTGKIIKPADAAVLREEATRIRGMLDC